MSAGSELKRPRSRTLAILFSLFIPGMGQAYLGEWRRGLGVFAAAATAAATVFWYGSAGWYAALALFWAWNVWDVIRLPRGASIALAALLWLGMAYGIGWQVTEINPLALFSNQERARAIVSPMLKPDFFSKNQEALSAWTPIQVPCSENPPLAEHAEAGWSASVDVNCAQVRQVITATASGLWPDTRVQVAWVTPIGSPAQYYEAVADANGNVTIAIEVPPEALAAAVDPNLPLEHHLSFNQVRQTGGWGISKNGKYVFQGIYETLALALLATTLGAVLALPFGFLAARNLMSGNVVTRGIYVLVRTILNVIRSIESLIMAIIFVIIVGLGSFAGMLAITLHTVAALGKLYSEVIEGIDSGPIEAIRATGASWLEIVRYGVIPQIVPAFTALTIYRWDINVRSSTIIGFVGGGGIGFFITQWILISDYRAVSAAVVAIALVVMALDFFSAKLRENIR